MGEWRSQAPAGAAMTPPEPSGLEAEVAARTAQLTGLARHLQRAREDERHRLARELHDELGALLTSAKLDVARIRSRLPDAAPDAAQRLAHLSATLDTIIALKRRIVEDLRPSALTHLGLADALVILTREFSAASGLQVHAVLEPVRLPTESELVVYRLVQEALTNVGRHAKARQVWLTLAEHEGRVTVSVKDDGVGLRAGAPVGASFGLMAMRYRVEAEHGRLCVRSAPGQGTQVTAVLPTIGTRQGPERVADTHPAATSSAGDGGDEGGTAPGQAPV